VIVRRLLLVLVAVLCAACTGGNASPRPGSTAPLPTAGSGKLICGMLPESSVQALLGDRKYTVEGAGVVRRSDGELDFATCAIQDPEKPGTDGRYLNVFTNHGADRTVLRDVYRRAWEYTFPAEVGLGAAQRQGDNGAIAKLLWGDHTLSVTIRRSAEGRDPLRDAIALVQEVGTALRISKTPSTPYPTRAEVLGATPSAGTN
jgi:hypothetical protein